MADHIMVDAIPGDNLDPDAIDAAAATIASVGSDVSTQGATLLADWQKISAHYQAPESGTLFAVMDPVKTNAETFGTNVETVSSALFTFADEVRPIKAELAAVKADAQAFVNDIADGVDVTRPAGRAGVVHENVDWDHDQASVDKNNALIGRVNAAMEKLWAAERACANKIYDVIGFPHIEAASESNPNGYGVDEIPEGTKMPWGAPAEREKGGCEKAVDSVGHFVWDGVIVGGIWGTVKGLGTLTLGYNPATGDFFSGDAYKAAWSNLGMLGVGLATNTGIVPGGGVMLAHLPGPVGKFFQRGNETLINAGKGLIAYDEWSKDPAAAAGTAFFNIGSILIPAGAAVDGVKAGSSAAATAFRTAARVTELVDPTSLALKGVTAATHVTAPVLADLVKTLKFPEMADLGKLDLPAGAELGDLGNLAHDSHVDLPGSLADGAGHSGVPKVDVPESVTVPNVGDHDFSFNPGGGAAEHVDVPPVREPVAVHEPVPVGSHGGEVPVSVADGSQTVVHTGAGHTGAGHTGAGHTGGGADVPAGAGAHGGSDVPSGSGAPHPADGSGAPHQAGDGSTPHTPSDPPVGGGGSAHDAGSAWHPDMGDPTLSDAGHGPGWTRDDGLRGDPIDPGYGQPHAQHGHLAPQYAAPKDISAVPEPQRSLVTDPNALYGHAPDGHRLSQAEFEERYMKAVHTPTGDRSVPIYPGNDGAVPGRRIDFTDVDQFTANYGQLLDRMGGDSGAFMSFPDTPFEQRALPPGNLGAPYSTLELSGHLPPGVKIEVSEIAPAFGQPGGGLQVRVLDDAGQALPISELEKHGILQHVPHDAMQTPHVVDVPTGADSAAGSAHEVGHHEGGRHEAPTGRHEAPGRHEHGRHEAPGRHESSRSAAGKHEAAGRHESGEHAEESVTEQTTPSVVTLNTASLDAQHAGDERHRHEHELAGTR